MTSPQPGQSADPLRNFLAIDERGPLIAWAQRPIGQCLIYAIALGVALTLLPWWQAVLIATAAMAMACRPQARQSILFTSTWLGAFLEIGRAEGPTATDIGLILAHEHISTLPATGLALALLLGVMLGAWALLAYVRRHPGSFLARRPLLSLLAVELLLCTLPALDALQGLPRVLLWSMLIVLTPYIWFLPYAVVDQRSRTPTDLSQQIGVLRPFWSPTYLPFGKGTSFLHKTLAKNPQELAVTQLKAVKLLLWTQVLRALKNGTDWLFLDTLQVPTTGDAIQAFLNGQPVPIAMAWAALTISTARYSLQVAMWAGLFVGMARLAGYRLPRGSWRPLESRTLMEYFNRFHFYFKELLVDNFFVPTFFSVFRKHPRLRMFFATFMAAGVGNACWHFLYDIQVLTSLGPAQALQSFSSYAFYCLVLAIGIGLSQVRASRGIRPSATPFGRVCSFLFVWSFVVGLHVFGDESRDHGLTDRFFFFLSLFGAI
jgi:hypothetical protein